MNYLNYFFFLQLLLPKCSLPSQTPISSFKEDIAINKEISILDGYLQINSVEQLLSKLKGHPILFDLWATWCEPCLDEFKFSTSVYAFSKQHEIQLLYVSFDDNDHDSIWRSSIGHYNLSGTHIRANKSLQAHLEFLVWGIEGAYSLPHYLLFDKNGRLVDKALPQPDSGQMLYDTIKKKMDCE